jgi:FtsP/CotA-like multicopper oxidase with cupredoxin domain
MHASMHASMPANGTGMDHATAGMAGLIVGVTVRPSPRVASRPGAEVHRRVLRLYADVRPARAGAAPAYGFVLQDGAAMPASDSVRRPGSPIVLRRGEPVQITVFNRLAVPLSVHWHGLELESYFDGVGGFSGSTSNIAPPVAPGDSFVVRMTPPRAGTFMYHVHGEDGDELAQGLYGALLVLDDPAARDTTVDHIVLVSDSTARRADGVVVNGSTGSPFTLVAGRAHRLRVIGITGALTSELLLRSGADTVRWRMVARDGAEVRGAAMTPARIMVSPGMIADYELMPATSGTLTLQVTNLPPNAARGTVPLRRWTAPIPVVAPPVVLGARGGSSGGR